MDDCRLIQAILFGVVRSRISGAKKKWLGKRLEGIADYFVLKNDGTALKNWCHAMHTVPQHLLVFQNRQPGVSAQQRI